MNSPVSPRIGRGVPPAAALSSARSVVVPMPTTRPPRDRVRAIASQVAAETSSHSRCSVCDSTVSPRIGANVPAPTCRVTRAISMPRSSIAASIASSKCRPAVGAATAPGRRAYTVW